MISADDKPKAYKHWLDEERDKKSAYYKFLRGKGVSEDEAMKRIHHDKLYYRPTVKE